MKKIALFLKNVSQQNERIGDSTIAIKTCYNYWSPIN